LHDVVSPSGKLPEGVVLQKPVKEQKNCNRKAYSMTRAQQLKCVLAIDIDKREQSGGSVRINAGIANPCCASKDEP